MTGDPEAETRIQSGSSRLGARPGARRLGQVDQIGPYAILSELGRGGMGAVYRCRHPHLQREVAVKVLLAGEHAGEKQVERFRREAEAAASLRHPNITAVHDVGQDQGRPFIVMDLIEGVSLQDRIDQGPLAPAEAARLALALARALAYAHSQGILHRDVKPSNVLITPEGEPLLTDFGLAKRVDTAEQGGITVTGQFLGTPGFMPPEQARGQGDRVDRRADVYALGATLYAMLAGDHPFADLTGVAVLGATIDQQPPSLLHERADLPRDLETICFTCLEKEPGDRYPSALDLADDLERFLKDEPIQAQPATALDRLRKWTRRNRALALVSVSALVVVLAGGLGVGLWTIRARAQAAVAEERARHDAVAEQRRGLAEAARRDVAALSAEQPASSGERIGRALAQLQAAQRWLVLTPDDPDARRAQFDAALTLGDLALETEQWGLARQAFEQMRGLGVGDAQATARIARVTEEREADERRRREEIETLLVRAEGGTLTARLGALDDALFTIVRRAGRGTVAQLTGRLDEISAALRAAELAIYKEGTRGQELTGLEEALAARAQVGTEALPAARRTLLKRADERLERQLKGLQIRPEARMLVAAGQASRLGAGPLTLAELICRGLGRLGHKEATASLGRYLAAEADGLRAVHAGRALARLGGAEAQLHLMRSFTRFGPLSLYSRRVTPLFALLPAAPPQVRAGEASTYLRRARYHDLRGEHAAAAKDCDEALRLEPTSTAALSLRALAMGAQNDFPAALRDLDRAIELAPDDPLLLCKRAEVRMILGQERWAGAREDIERAIRLDPTVSDPWSLRGRLRDRSGDLDGAENDFGLAIARDPREAGVLVNRGILRSRRGDHARAFTDLTRALSLNPSMPTAWSNRAVIRRRMGDIAGAEDDYGRALRLDPGLANAWMNRGHLRQLRGDLDGAVRDYEECLRRNPNQRDATRALVLAREQRRAVEGAKGPQDAPNWLRAGEQMLREGAKDRAFLAFSIAIRIDPTLAAAWAARGDMHARAGENTLALRDYERALELEPLRASAWVNRGAARFAMEQLKDARLDFDQALRLDPRQHLTWYNRGVLRYEQGDLRGAERDLSQCLKRRPTMVQALVWRGVVRRWLGNLKGGRQDLEQILKRSPRHDGALAYRAMIRLEEGDPAGALADANQALKTNRRASPAWLARGVVLAQQPSQKRAALVALENSLRLGITGLDAQLARSTLAELGAR